MYNLMCLDELEENIEDYEETLAGRYPWHHSFQVLDESAKDILLELNNAKEEYHGDYLINYIKINRGNKK